jgi:hypothetical protein
MTQRKHIDSETMDEKTQFYKFKEVRATGKPTTIRRTSTRLLNIAKHKPVQEKQE